MRSVVPFALEKCRIVNGSIGGSAKDGFAGVFRIHCLLIISSGPCPDWEHVSVSRSDKQIPSWMVMCRIKRLFFLPEECVVQFHPPDADHINVNPGVLHLWRCVDREFPMPPKAYV